MYVITSIISISIVLIAPDFWRDAICLDCAQGHTNFALTARCPNGDQKVRQVSWTEVERTA